MKKKIVIAEYVSTGINLVYDVLSRGYEPVLLDCAYIGEDEDVEIIYEMRAAVKSSLPDNLTIIPENPDYQAVLEQVRALDPILVIAGSEFGVPYATRLAEDLGLPGNPASRLKEMTEKDSMHQALKDYGIRYIRGKVIKSLEEAISFYEEIGVKQVVVKRVRGVGTQGVYLCNDRSEMIDAVNKELSLSVKNGDENVGLLIQEQIIGTEYVVNTVSCNGKHRLISLWKYNKVRMPNGTNAYNFDQTVNILDVGHSRLISYAYDVLDAVGIKYGPVHGEFMVDEKGPVLIEINCRPMGGGLQRKFVERIFGHHETDCALDSYLNPAKFEADMEKSYRPLRKGAIKSFILPKDTIAESTPILQICKRLKSYDSGIFDRIGRERIIGHTRNLETTGGTIYLVHKNEQVVLDDCNLLHNLEMNYPDILFQSSLSVPVHSAPERNIPVLLNETKCGGGTLIFSDQNEYVEGATVVNEKDLRLAYDSYEQGILDLSKPETFQDLEILVQQIYEFSDKIREGGRIIIPESTYCNLPYGMEGIEILLKVAGLQIECPRANMKNVVIASVIK